MIEPTCSTVGMANDAASPLLPAMPFPACDPLAVRLFQEMMSPATSRGDDEEDNDSKA